MITERLPVLEAIDRLEEEVRFVVNGSADTPISLRGDGSWFRTHMHQLSALRASLSVEPQNIVDAEESLLAFFEHPKYDAMGFTRTLRLIMEGALLSGGVEWGHDIRRFLWLRHGHKGMYGDDGEMQCGECAKYHCSDYKRAPLEEVISAAWKAAVDTGRLEIAKYIADSAVAETEAAFVGAAKEYARVMTRDARNPIDGQKVQAEIDRARCVFYDTYKAMAEVP